MCRPLIAMILAAACSLGPWPSESIAQTVSPSATTTSDAKLAPVATPSHEIPSMGGSGRDLASDNGANDGGSTNASQPSKAASDEYATEPVAVPVDERTQADLAAQTASPGPAGQGSCTSPWKANTTAADPSCTTLSASHGCTTSASEKKDASKAEKPKPSCAKSHKPLFYDNDFSYLSDPEYTDCCLGDSLKRLPRQGPSWGKIDFGGQNRLRFHSERGMGQQAGATRFEATNNEFLLLRTRLYANWEMSDNIRFFVEGIYADLAGNNDEYIRRGIDENWGDINNLFFDFQLTENTNLRVGRQELLLGAQRTVSPLDWANTRRRFDGVRVTNNYENYTADWFYTNFVPVNARDFDIANDDIAFYGLYTTYKTKKETFDLYYLGYDTGLYEGDFSVHTIGARAYAAYDDWLYELEAGGQFGRQSGRFLDQNAAFATVGAGRVLSDHPYKPTLWVYYDYASGNNIGGSYNRYNQLFPLAHKYLGFIDAVQRANVESPNVLLTMTPHKKLKLLFWYYHFMSNQDSDVVPSIGGTPAQSTSSKDFGDELDILATYNLTPRNTLLIGYSHFWRGNKILADKDADFVYVQLTTNF